jgi:cytochrome d ubiquinol oxidase subunit II
LAGLTLFIMLLAVVVFLPVVLTYTGLVLRVMRGRVRFEDVERHEAFY